MRTLLVGLLLLLSALSAGCVEHRDINDLNMVLGALIDYDPQQEKYIVYTQVASPSAFSKNGSGQGKAGFMLFQGEGDTFYQAIRDIAKNSGKRLFWSHCYVYVITERLAQQGFFGVLDLLFRDYEVREAAYFMVTDRQPAQFVTLENAEENVPMIILKELLEMGMKRHGTTFPKELGEVFRDLSEDNSYLIPLVSTDKPDLKTKSPVVTDQYHANRAVVFKKDKMIGTLSSEETRGYLWVTQPNAHSIVVVEVQGKQVSLEEIQHRAKITPRINQGEISFLVEVEFHMNYGEIDQPANVLDRQFIAATQQSASRKLEQEITKSNQRAQAMQADFFNFGRELQLTYPDTWQMVQKEWADQVFPEVTVEVAVKTQLNRTGLITGLITSNTLEGMVSE